jgi:hypothetical protein
MRLSILFAIFLVFVSISSCKKNEIDEVTGKPKIYEMDNRARIRAAADKGGILSFGGDKNSGNTNYEFSTSNVMWRASLDVLNFIPLQSVSYSGGLIITDWYEKNNEAIKIEVNFKSTELSSAAVEVKSFKRTCDSLKNCSIINTNSDFNENIKTKILNKARELSIKDLKKK